VPVVPQEADDVGLGTVHFVCEVRCSCRRLATAHSMSLAES
jgi:hypothetical protein